jgi:hypothetical protein
MNLQIPSGERACDRDYDSNVLCWCLFVEAATIATCSTLIKKGERTHGSTASLATKTRFGSFSVDVSHKSGIDHVILCRRHRTEVMSCVWVSVPSMVILMSYCCGTRPLARPASLWAFTLMTGSVLCHVNQYNICRQTWSWSTRKETFSRNTALWSMTWKNDFVAIDEWVIVLYTPLERVTSLCD